MRVHEINNGSKFQWRFILDNDWTKISKSNTLLVVEAIDDE